MDLVGSTVVVEKPENGKEVHDFSDLERNELFVSELDHFLECVDKREQPLVSVEEGAITLEIALAIKKSMQTGSIVEPDLWDRRTGPPDSE